MKIERQIYIYYLFLLVVLSTWVSAVSAPPLVFRLTFLSALFLPALFKAPKLIVPVMVCFFSIAAYGFSCSYMPTELIYYLGIMAFAVFFLQNYSHATQRPPVPLTLLTIYAILIDFATGLRFVNIDYSLVILLLSFFVVSKDGTEKNAYMLSFELISIVLCIYFFTFGQTSAGVGDSGRIEWVDPNYMGSVCAMGVVLAYNVLINKWFVSSRLFFLISIICFLLGVVMLVLNASRGAFLSMAIAITIITCFSKIPIKKKIIVSCVVIIGVLVVYSLGLFELLEERVRNDDGTGNARTLIWAAKMDAFFRLPVLQQVFGLGYKGGFELAFPGGFGFHNDYLAFVVEYGYVGFALFLAVMIYPILIVRRHSPERPIVVSLIVFLLTCSATLEPFSAGRLTFWYYYMLIVIISRWSKSYKNAMN